MSELVILWVISFRETVQIWTAKADLLWHSQVASWLGNQKDLWKPNTLTILCGDSEYSKTQLSVVLNQRSLVRGSCLFGRLVGLFCVCMRHVLMHVPMCLCMFTHARVQMYMSGDSLQGSVLSFYHVNSTDQTRVVRLSCKHPCPKSHLTSPEILNLDSVPWLWNRSPEPKVPPYTCRTLFSASLFLPKPTDFTSTFNQGKSQPSIPPATFSCSWSQSQSQKPEACRSPYQAPPLFPSRHQPST